MQLQQQQKKDVVMQQQQKKDVVMQQQLTKRQQELQEQLCSIANS